MLILFFKLISGIVRAMTPQEVETHLEAGKKLLAAGPLADALTQFHSAIGMCFKKK